MLLSLWDKHCSRSERGLGEGDNQLEKQDFGLLRYRLPPP